MTAAWYGGLKPGLSATLLAALTSQYLFMQEGLSFTPTRLGDAVNLGLFVVEGSFISLLADQLFQPAALVTVVASLAGRCG